MVPHFIQLSLTYSWPVYLFVSFNTTDFIMFDCYCMSPTLPYKNLGFISIRVKSNKWFYVEIYFMPHKLLRTPVALPLSLKISISAFPLLSTLSFALKQFTSSASTPFRVKIGWESPSVEHEIIPQASMDSKHSPPSHVTSATVPSLPAMFSEAAERRTLSTYSNYNSFHSVPL